MVDITFKGISASSLGMVVEKMPDAVRAKRRVKAIHIPGRDGELHQDEETYEPVKLTARLNAFGNATSAQISEWLDGSGQLILSDDPGKYYDAIVIDQVTHGRDRSLSGRNYDTTVVTFKCEPFRRVVNQQAIKFTTMGIVPNTTKHNAFPLIKLTGSGDIIFLAGARSLQIAGVSGIITIDCEAEIATNSAGESITTKMTGDWPVIAPGGTPINWTGIVSLVEVYPNWRYN
jgi:Phage-related protein